jgi:hypothetical protein
MLTVCNRLPVPLPSVVFNPLHLATLPNATVYHWRMPDEGRRNPEPDVMHTMADAIRASVAHGKPADFPRDVGYDGESDMDGRYLLRWHAYRERNSSLRQKKIDSVVATGGPLACEVCSFDFAQTYGERGRGYIECHHVEPLHAGGEGPRTFAIWPCSAPTATA